MESSNYLYEILLADLTLNKFVKEVRVTRDDSVAFLKDFNLLCDLAEIYQTPDCF